MADSNNPSAPNSPNATPAVQKAVLNANLLKNAENLTLRTSNLEGINNATGGTWTIDPKTCSPKEFAEMFETMMRAVACGPDQNASVLEGAKGQVDLGTAPRINNVAGGMFDFTGGKKGK